MFKNITFVCILFFANTIVNLANASSLHHSFTYVALPLQEKEIINSLSQTSFAFSQMFVNARNCGHRNVAEKAGNICNNIALYSDYIAMRQGNSPAACRIKLSILQQESDLRALLQAHLKQAQSTKDDKTQEVCRWYISCMPLTLFPQIF